MVTKKPKGLGRGLEALLGPTAMQAASGSTPAAPGQPASLMLTDIVPGQYQPRTRMDEGALYELAESIKAQGIMQPILVRKLAHGANSGKFEIIAGERRFRAAKLAGLDSVPVLVRDVPDEAAAAMALIENIQREDLNPLEEAHGLQRLVKDFGLTHEQAAQAVGRTDTALGIFYRRKKAHLGPAKATTATARKLACLVYHLLKYKEQYREPDPAAYQLKVQKIILAKIQKQAAALGYKLLPTALVPA